MEALTQKLNNSNYFGNFSSPFALQQEELTQISSSKPIQSNIYSYNNRSPSRIYENNHLIPNVPSNPYLSFPNQNQTYSSSNYDNKIIYNLVSPKNPSHFQNQDQTFQKNEIFNERNLNNDIPPFLKNFQTYPYERKPPLPLPFKDRQNIPERGQSPLLSPFPNNNIRGIPSNNIRESPLNNSFSNNNRIREQSNIYPPFYNQKPLNTAHSYESPYRMKNSFIPDIPISISMPGFQSPDNFQMRPDFKGFNENPLYFSKNHPNENFMNYSGPPGQPLFYNNKLNEQIKENNVFPDFITAFGTYKHYDLTSKGSKFRKIIKQTNSNVDSNFSTDMTYLNVNFLQQSHYDKIFDALKNFVLFDRNVEKLKEELAHKTDFDIRILFQYFDDNNSGQIVITEWRVGFLKLGISAEEKDIYLMVNKYSKDGNKKIGFNEFCEMILPANGTNKEYLMKKDTRQKHLSNDSHHIAVKLFKMILNISYSSELIRNEIQDEKINIREVFNFIDHSKGGIISRDELKNFMSKYEFHLLAGDLENLMNRFDRNQSGKINFKEFEYELLPKFVEN